MTVLINILMQLFLIGLATIFGLPFILIGLFMVVTLAVGICELVFCIIAIFIGAIYCFIRFLWNKTIGKLL